MRHLVCLLLMVFAGCASSGGGQRVTPGDFVKDASETPREATTPTPPAPPTTAQTTAHTTAQTTDESPELAPAPLVRIPESRIAEPSDSEGASGGEAAKPLVVDAMVGQVNGRPLYASRVLAPIDAQLKSMSQVLTASRFEQEARGLVLSALEPVVLDQLILAEAERDMNDGERDRMRAIMKEHRGELLRRYGRGSPELADKTLREQKGKGLETTLEEFRQGVIVSRYRQQKLFLRVNVARRDVEREYDRLVAESQQARPSFTVALISASDPAAVTRIQQRLDAGEPFDAVAADAGNLSGSEAMTVETLGVEELNTALQTMREGEVSPPIQARDRSWWLHVTRVERPDPVPPLEEVYGSLESRLREQQLRELTIEFRKNLLERGNFDPLPRMLEALMEVVLTRYVESSA